MLGYWSSTHALFFETQVVIILWYSLNFCFFFCFSGKFYLLLLPILKEGRCRSIWCWSCRVVDVDQPRTCMEAIASTWLCAWPVEKPWPRTVASATTVVPPSIAWFEFSLSLSRSLARSHIVIFICKCVYVFLCIFMYLYMYGYLIDYEHISKLNLICWYWQKALW